jgi:NADH-quinone oxidoreductase subunit B
VGSEKRPLSWVVGDQGVYKAAPPSLRDLKRAERTAMETYRPINEV